MANLVIKFQNLGKHDVEIVGGKNASLGEMISNLANAGVSVPGGFATTAQAYRDFLEQSGLNQRINDVLDSLDVDDVVALADAGRKIRQWVVDTPLLPALDAETALPRWRATWVDGRIAAEDVARDARDGATPA